MPLFNKTVHWTSSNVAANVPANVLSQGANVLVLFMVIFIVTEKEKKHIASMEIMGLRPLVYWLSWVIIYYTAIAILSLIVLAIAMGTGIINHSNFALLLIDCLLFGGSVLAVGFCVASVVKRPLVAGAIAYVLLTAFFLLYFVEVAVEDLSAGAKWGLAIFAPAAFAMSFARVNETALLKRMFKNMTEMHSINFIKNYQTHTLEF